MRLSYTTKAAAQTVATRIHQDLIALNGAYKASVQAGFTQQWAIPYLEAGKHHVTVNIRCRAVLTAAEVAKFPEWATEQP